MRLAPLLLGLAACSDYKLEPGTPVVDGADTACALEAGGDAVPTDETCVVVPVVGTFEPVVEWQWSENPVYPGYNQIMSTPAVGNLTDDNGDGLIDDQDVPDVVFTAFAGSAYTSAGPLTALSGDGSGQLWSITEAGGFGLYSSGSPAIGDLDGDGVPEVCTAGIGVGVVCVEADGTFRWAGGSEPYGYGAPAFADVDADGSSEVIFGRTLLDADGNERWSGVDGTGWYFSFAADLDDNGILEIIAGNTVYNADGTERWNDGTLNGPPAMGDFDLDGVPEIVHVYPPNVYLTGADGVLRWTGTVPSGGGGPPTVADFDGDGYPEVGVAGAYEYVVFDTDGSVLWSAPVQDYSSSVTGSSVFDFEGDGRADVVYADEVTLWVYDGATGSVKFRLDDHASGTLYEYPLVVDVDHDGASEIVLASNNYAFSGWTGITVIGDANSSWRPSRPVWNQFAYSITNVNDDGSIPREQEPNWERYNNFRTGGTTLGLSSQLADLTAGPPDVCLVQCSDDTVQFTVPVQNTGLADSLLFTAELYTSTGALLSSQVMTLAAGESRDFGPMTIPSSTWTGRLFLRLDDANVVEECDETDNVADLGPWPCP